MGQLIYAVEMTSTMSMKLINYKTVIKHNKNHQR